MAQKPLEGEELKEYERERERSQAQKISESMDQKLGHQLTKAERLMRPSYNRALAFKTNSGYDPKTW